MAGIGEWTGIPQRSRHLALELAQHISVLYVNPCYYSAFGLIRDSLLGRSNRDNVYQISHFGSGSGVLSLPPLLPKGLSYPLIAHVNYLVLLPLMKQAMRKLGIESPILWVSLPPDHALLGKLNERLAIYDCMDMHSAFRSGRAALRLSREERRLLDQADVVIASSQALFEHCSEHKEDVYLVRNGVDPKVFRSRASRSRGIRRRYPEEERANPRPIVGYVGTIGKWVDLRTLWEIAFKMPDMVLRMVGPVQIDVSDLSCLPNVEIYGEVPYDHVPTYVSDMDVCLLPFRNSELTRAVNPIKLYEYFALGKPVVSTPLPEVAVHQDILYMANAGSEFVDAVRDAINEGENSELIKKRMALADENSWSQRAEHIIQILNKHL